MDPMVRLGVVSLAKTGMLNGAVVYHILITPKHVGHTLYRSFYNMAAQLLNMRKLGNFADCILQNPKFLNINC
jgi:hypothetical protein